MATYAAMVEMVDDGIGEVADVLKKKGLYENTVFLFLSDDHGSTSHGCSGSSTSRI
jgi:arylsulfatase